MTNTAFERYDAAVATIRAISQVPGLFPFYGDLDHPPQEDHLSWGLTYEQEHASRTFAITSDAEGGVDVAMSVNTRDDFVVLAHIEMDNPHVSTLTAAIVLVATGSTHIPPINRKMVRDVLANARTDAEFHYRVGMDYLLTTVGATKTWGNLDEPDKWSVILDSYALASNVRSDMVGYMNSWRKIGVPLTIVDIYDDAYVERASELVAGITRGSTP